MREGGKGRRDHRRRQQRDPVFSDAASGNLFYDVGGTTVLVYQTGFAGTAQNTALNLVTDDLDRDATELRTRGVVFHEYDFPGLKTVDGIAQLGDTRGAWFSDSEDNSIAIRVIRRTLTPLATAASSLSPVALIRKPNRVRPTRNQ